MNNKLNTCPECGRDHSIDVETYPAGLRVVVLGDFTGGYDADGYKPSESRTPPRITIPKGSLGKITGHTDDGRVMVEFEAEKWRTVHTFHQPEEYFKPVATATKTVEVEVVTWACPMCDRPMEASYEPADDHLYCRACQDIIGEREKAEWVARFKADYAHLIGAVIVDLTPYDEYWWDTSEPEIDRLVVEKGGERYEVGAENGVLWVKATDTLPCGHPLTSVIVSSEGTQHCRDCEAEANDAPD